MKFEFLGLDTRLLGAIKKMGYEHCMPVQEQALPETLLGRDVSVQAQTGTGKTAVFLVTALQRMIVTNEPGGTTRVLVLVPTRELAVQVEQQAVQLCKFLPFKSVSVYGGVGYDKQEDMLARGAEIIVATPGRLIDFIKSGKLNLETLLYFIIDEADRMFDMGFMPDVRYILKKAPDKSKRQTMIFSATLDHRVRRLAASYMNDPVEVEIEPDQITVEKVKQMVYHASMEEKIPLLLTILQREHHDKVIIFTNMKRTAEMIGFKLTGNGVAAEVLTGDVNQSRRLRIINKIKEDKLSVLVATDVAARGLHIDGITHVINYDIPTDAASYVHRIGRTARAGENGVAYSIGCEHYVEYLPVIERFIEKKVEVMSLDFEMVEDKAGSFRGSRPRSDSGRGGRGAPRFSDRRPSGRSSSSDRSSDRGRPKKSSAPRAGARPQSETGTSDKPPRKRPPRRRAGKPGGDRKKNMTADERMSYYREKYGDAFDPSRVSPSKGNHRPKKAGVSAGKSSSPAKAKAPVAAAHKAPEKKKGLFGKIMGKFRKKA